ncbi:MAG: primosomal protein N' [Firmicutes bacterium]|nr:primosomal protein N' [Bacillota bacterium]
MKFARVIIDASMGRGQNLFDYKIPDDLEVSVGSRVSVPFGPRVIEGFVLDIVGSTELPNDKIKEVIKSLDDFPAIKTEAIKITPQICEKFKLRHIDILRMFIPSSLRGRVRKRKPKNKEIHGLDIKKKDISLTPAQDKVVKTICSAKGEVFVLHGVTGSGKTEVYMNVIERELAQGRTAIMLVPEIGLTPQMLGNFRARFGDKVAIIHSGLTVGERYDEWYRLFTGEAKIAIGARSAIFAPLDNIGVIVIDEEHDTSYFSESNPRFHTHEVAKIRCKFWGANLVLGSATPSVETFYRAQSGIYKLLTLDKRVCCDVDGNCAKMPTVEVVDMAEELRAGNNGIFSNVFLARLEQTLVQKKQAIVFLNRRGFSSYIMCRGCGWVARCEHCDVSMVFHKDDKMLKCHYCDSRFTAPSVCQGCKGTQLKFGATGTQKVVEELQEKFPNTKVFRMDADTIKNKDDLLSLLGEFTKTPSSILVGTQMLAKGHHFPDVTLVGIVDADNSLHFSDFRATERTFSIMTQVAGRCGREKDVGHVVLQTHMPNHYVYRLAANYDYLRFYDKEVNMRAVTKYPPFTMIVRVLVTGERDDKIKDALKTIMAELRTRQKDFFYLGAMKSPLGRIDDKFRYQILCRFDVQNETEMLSFIDDVVSRNKPKNLSVFLEINPQSLS